MCVTFYHAQARPQDGHNGYRLGGNGGSLVLEAKGCLVLYNNTRKENPPTTLVPISCLSEMFYPSPTQFPLNMPD